MTVVLHVPGMHCGGCEQRIQRVLARVEGVREVTADHTTGRVTVRVGPELSDRSVLDQRVETAGFEIVREA